jgi:hypothetical protein
MEVNQFKYAPKIWWHDWLVHLTRGVVALPGDALTRDGCLVFGNSDDSIN